MLMRWEDDDGAKEDWNQKAQSWVHAVLIVLKILQAEAAKLFSSVTVVWETNC